MIRRGAHVARAVLPERVFRETRRGLAALLTPLLWSVKSGHFRSALAERALDSHGHPIPWYTYPAIDFLTAQSFAGKTVLEIGAGQSTLWWAKRVETVVSLEGDTSWYEYVRRAVPQNVKLYLASDLPGGFDPGLLPKAADVIVIDGLNRLAWARETHSLLGPGGAIILDNSEGYWGGDEHGTYPIIDFYRERGLQRVDFYGLAPGVIQPHCTSLFFGTDCFLVRGDSPPVRVS